MYARNSSELSLTNQPKPLPSLTYTRSVQWSLGPAIIPRKDLYAVRSRSFVCLFTCRARWWTVICTSSSPVFWRRVFVADWKHCRFTYSFVHSGWLTGPSETSIPKWKMKPVYWCIGENYCIIILTVTFCRVFFRNLTNKLYIYIYIYIYRTYANKGLCSNRGMLEQGPGVNTIWNK